MILFNLALSKCKRKNERSNPRKHRKQKLDTWKYSPQILFNCFIFLLGAFHSKIMLPLGNFVITDLFTQNFIIHIDSIHEHFGHPSYQVNITKIKIIQTRVTWREEKHVGVILKAMCQGTVAKGEGDLYWFCFAWVKVIIIDFKTKV